MVSSAIGVAEVVRSHGAMFHRRRGCSSLAARETRELVPPVPIVESREARFHRLIAEHGRALARLAAAYAREPGDREDLLQDIALAFWRALPSFRGESSERTFLYRIAHNRAITHRARHLARTRPLERLEGDELADPDRGPADRVLAAERQDDLMDAVRRLTPALRETVVLSLEGLSHGEIADVLGTNSRTVAVRLTRARAALAALLRSESAAGPKPGSRR
jgi:RNA polymerase sigma factor (sigma-70 family)